MEFEIRNIGNFSQADIEVGGITLIAGENNTGKSTIEKAISLTLSSLYGLTDYIQADRYRTLSITLNKQGTILDNLLKNISGSDKSRNVGDVEKLQENYAHAISINTPMEKEGLTALLKEYSGNHARYYEVEYDKLINLSEYAAWLDDTTDKIRADMSVSDDTIGKNSITEYVDNFFKNQIVKFGSEDADSYIRMSDNGYVNRMAFEHSTKTTRDSCSDLQMGMPVMSPMVYIDSTDIFDKINMNEMSDPQHDIRYMLSPGRKNGVIFKNVWNSIQKNDPHKKQYEPAETAIQKEQTQNLVDRFDGIISDIVHGHLKISASGEFRFAQDGSKRTIDMQNLSTGIKSFSVLSTAIQYRCIVPGSVILLDEPEINLHPDWQLKYAELLVRIQKEMDLKIIITTHSPYFVNAIEAYSKKYKTQDGCRFYLTESSDTGYIAKDVTADVRPIYAKLARPFDILEQVEDEDEGDN